jgi:hypothetical protein
LANIKDSTAKYDYRQGGNQKWRAQIESIQLERLTPDTVASWMKKHVADTGASQTAIASARRTANAYVRGARALFCTQLLKEPGIRKLKLPDPLSFKGVELFDVGSAGQVSRHIRQSR